MDLHAVWKVMQRSLRPKSSFSQRSPLTRLSDKITTRKLTCTIDLPNLLRCRQLVLHALMCVRECLYLVLCIFITGRFAWPPPWSRYRMVPSQRSPVPPFHKHGHLLPSSLLSLNYGNHSFSCLYNSVTLRMSYKWGQTVDTLSIVFFFSHSAKFSCDPSKWLHVSVGGLFYCCVVVHGIDTPLCVLCSPIHTPKDIWVISSFCQLQIKLLWTFVYIGFCVKLLPL